MLKKLALAAAILAAASAIHAADMTKLPNPLANAKVGQWVLYNILGQFEQKQTITNIEGSGDDRVLTIKVEFIVGGEVQESQEREIGYAEALEEQAKGLEEVENLTINEEKMTIKDQTVDGVLVTFTQDDEKCYLYLSSAVPVVGMVKMTMGDDDMAMMELVDFGE